MKVIATQHFVHGVYSLARGQHADIPDGIAADLHKAGFVQPHSATKAPAAPAGKKAPPVANKMAAPAANKAAEE